MLNLAMSNIKVGATTMVGQGLIGGISSMVPGSAKAANTINSGLGLINVGMFANTGIELAKSIGGYKVKYKNKGKSDIISKII